MVLAYKKPYVGRGDVERTHKVVKQINQLLADAGWETCTIAEALEASYNVQEGRAHAEWHETVREALDS